MRQMLLAALLLLLGGCGRESEADYVARQLDMDLPEPVSVISGDSHGGFHGDGGGGGLPPPQRPLEPRPHGRAYGDGGLWKLWG